MYRMPLLTGPGYKRILGIVVPASHKGRRHRLERTLIHMAATRTSRKNTAAQAELTAAASKAPGTDVEVVESVPATIDPTLTLIVASETVRNNAISKVAHLIAENGVLSAKADRTFESMAKEYLRLRRMFPATDSVKAVLGEDAPDLAGRTPDYKLALAKLNDEAESEMVLALRKEGFTIKLATANAEAEMERVRKSITRYVRIAIEGEAKALLKAEGREAAARFVLGHGFGYSGEVTSKSYAGVIEDKTWKLAKQEDGSYALALPAGKVIGSDGRTVTNAKPLDAPPVEQSDQATPTETAEAQATQDAAEMGVTTGTPQGRINLAVGELNTARADKRLVELPAKERVALARLIGVAAFEAMLAIGESLTGSDRVQVARMFEQISTVTTLRLDPQEVAPAAK